MLGSWSGSRVWLAAILGGTAGDDQTLATPSGAESAASTSGEFEAFFWRFERQIYSYLWRLTGDQQLAFDLSQETFLRAWQHFDAIAAHRENGAWLFRVASNLALTQRRRHTTVAAATPLREDDAGANDLVGMLAEQEQIRAILEALPPRQRAVLLLRDVHGFTGEEVGRTLGISAAAVKMALSRARAQFRARYLRAEEE